MNLSIPINTIPLIMMYINNKNLFEKYKLTPTLESTSEMLENDNMIEDNILETSFYNLTHQQQFHIYSKQSDELILFPKKLPHNDKLMTIKISMVLIVLLLFIGPVIL